MWLPGVAIVALLQHTRSFNLDKNHAQVLEDPQGDADSYFGYTLSFYKHSLLVGAPKGKNKFDPNLVRSGVVYTCNAIERVCSQIKLSNTTAENVEKVRDVDAWIGSVISVHESRGILVCGGRLLETAYQTEYPINGGCYLKKHITSNEDSKLMVPLFKGSNQVVDHNGIIYFYYQHGQAGMSALLSKNGNELVLGAPGFGTGVGTLIRYTYDADSNDFIEKPPEPKSVITPDALYQYLGYAVVSGNFVNGNEAFVGGAPRADKGKGQVILMTTSPSSDDWNKLDRETGEAMGDGYGSSLAAADINGDGFDDLLVGAPRAGDMDTGRIYVYLGSSTVINFENPKKIEGFQPWTQFGTAVAAIGDINQDGCQDFAVGVPFEAEGVIYIYLGDKGPNGFRRNYSQRIAAADLGGLSNPPRGFGISFAGGEDIDGNGVTDVAVGSFESGNVVLLRTRPPLILLPSFPDALPPVPINASSIDVRVCLSYTGNLTEPANASIIVEDVVEAIVTLRNRSVCSSVEWIIKDRGFFAPIYLTAKAHLITGNFSTEFCKHCPEPDPESPVAKTVAYYASDCKNKSACVGDIYITAEFQNVLGPVTISPNTVLSIKVTARSASYSDPAHMLSFNLMFSSNGVKIIKPPRCHNNSGIFECPTSSSLLPGDSMPLDVVLDISAILAGTDSLVVNITANSGIIDENLENNIWVRKLPLNSKADATVIGDSDVPYIDFNQLEVNSTKVLSARHTFEVQNKGPALLENVTLLVSIPSEIKFKGIYRRIVNIEKPFSTDLTCNHVSGPNFILDKPEVIYDTAEAIPQDVKSEKKAFCNSDNVTCTIVKCNSNEIYIDKPIKITFSLLFDRHVLAEILSVYDLELVSKAELAEMDRIQPENNLPNYATCSTKMIGPLPKPFIATWMWVVPTLTALLIVGILIIVLYKCNFFKRKKFLAENEQEELEFDYTIS